MPLRSRDIFSRWCGGSCVLAWEKWKSERKLLDWRWSRAGSAAPASSMCLNPPETFLRGRGGTCCPLRVDLTRWSLKSWSHQQWSPPNLERGRCLDATRTRCQNESLTSWTSEAMITEYPSPAKSALAKVVSADHWRKTKEVPIHIVGGRSAEWSIHICYRSQFIWWLIDKS